MSDPSADPAEGLAAERTRLSWRRTALGLAAGSIAVGRLLQDVVGPASWSLTLAGLCAATAMLLAALRRYRAGAAGVAGGGRLVSACAAGSVVIGAASLWVILHGGA